MQRLTINLKNQKHIVTTVNGKEQKKLVNTISFHHVSREEAAALVASIPQSQYASHSLTNYRR